ncbi:MAG: hypothetical protein OHK0045_16180 [Raineya sp.]
MFTERLWDLIKAYINEAVDAALEERGYSKQESNHQSQQKHHKTAFEEFQENYEKYKKYQQKSNQYYQKSYQNSYQNAHSQNSEEIKYYQWLELPYGSSFEEIKKSYKALMKKYHPDNFHNNETKRQTAEKLSQKLNEAYQYFEKKYNKK